MTKLVDEVLTGEDPQDDPPTNFNMGFLEELDERLEAEDGPEILADR